MRVGIVVPTFHEDAARVVRLAREAERSGIDGVFLYDHLWHIGRKDHPALHGPTLMSAVAVSTSTLTVGSLVARVGLQSNEVLASMMSTVERIAPGRVIATIGIGDALSRDENETYGIEFAPRPARLAQMVECCRLLRAGRLPVWVAGTSDAVWEIAAGEADGVNLWDVDPAVVERARRVAQPAEVTWAGLVRMADGADHLSARLRAIGEAGATWAIAAIVGLEDEDVPRFAEVAASTFH
ncbi:MAG TPA: LLM class flavin-dependent oxidoreductase [Acidimicrobiales bacterium]|nr:LLM class flavin-dependent oxidoreductase [Acidimicrobiales bacterium]